MLGLDGKMLPGTGEKPPDPEKPEEAPATARMFYVAYFKKNAGTVRPVTFLYNGGHGGSAVGLCIGAFGPAAVGWREGAERWGGAGRGGTKQEDPRVARR